MEENKGAGGDPGTPELTREQVMAQRAEKKKIKEARKNKSSNSSDGGTPGTPEPKPQTPKANKGQKPKGETPGKQQQQQKSETPEGKQQKQQQSRADKDNVTLTEEEQLQREFEEFKPRKTSSPRDPFPDSTSISPENTAYSTVISTETSELSESSSGQSTTLKALTEDSKAGTPERSSLGSKSIIDFQSTIQSLFTVNIAPNLVKDITFQLHPLFHNLGVKLIHNVIRGTNLRCVKLLETIKEYVRSYETPSGMSFKHGLSNDLQMNMDALRRKCPFAIGMNNAVEHLTAFLYKLDQDVKDIHVQKDKIRDEIDVYVEEKIEKAVEAIVLYGGEKVRSGDVIMIYSITEAVLSLLEKAANGDEGEEGKSFELIIIQTPETMLDIPVLLKKLGMYK